MEEHSSTDVCALHSAWIAASESVGHSIIVTFYLSIPFTLFGFVGLSFSAFSLCSICCSLLAYIIIIVSDNFMVYSFLLGVPVNQVETYRECWTPHVYILAGSY